MSTEFNVDLPPKYVYDSLKSVEENLQDIDTYTLSLHTALEDALKDLFSRLSDVAEDAVADNIATLNEDGSVKDSGVDISTDGTLGDNVDTSIPTEKAVKTYADGIGGISNVVEDVTPQLGGHLDMNGKNIGGNSEADLDDAVAKKHTANADTALGAQSENLDMNTHKIVGVTDPTTDQEAATKKYVDDNAGGLENYTAGDYLVDSLDTARTRQGVDYPTFGKIKSIKIPAGGTLRISFTLAGGTVYGKIYRNGGAVGTEQSGNGTYSEDLAGWSAQDTVELWLASTPGNIATGSNFRLYTGTAVDAPITVTDANSS